MRSFPINLPYGLFLDSSRNFGVGTPAPATFVEFQKNQAAPTVVLVTNFNTGPSVSAISQWRTGTANSDVTVGVADNSGSPYLLVQSASAVTGFYYNAPIHVFRSTGSAEIARFEASSSSLKFAVDGIALTGTATAAQFWANTASKILTADNVWSSAVPVVVTYAASVTLNFGTFINAKITLTGNLTIDTTGVKFGQSGTIDFIQDATGGRTLALTASKFAYCGTAPTLASAANARTRLFYYVDENSRVFLSGSSTAVTYN